MRKTSMTKVAAAAMAAAMMLTACGGGNAATATTAAPAADNGAATQTEAASTGATITDTDIVVAMGADIVTCDPANQNDTTSSVFMNHVYQTLMTINDDGELVILTVKEENGEIFVAGVRSADGKPAFLSKLKF